MQRTDPRGLWYQPCVDSSHGSFAGPTRPLQVIDTLLHTATISIYVSSSPCRSVFTCLLQALTVCRSRPIRDRYWFYYKNVRVDLRSWKHFCWLHLCQMATGCVFPSAAIFCGWIVAKVRWQNKELEKDRANSPRRLINVPTIQPAEEESVHKANMIVTNCHFKYSTDSSANFKCLFFIN